MSSQEGPRGVEVLQIDSVKVIQHYEGEDLDLASGALQVLLVTLDVEDPTRSPKLRSEKLGEDYSTDLWIVLNVGEFSLPIKASQRIEPKRSSSSYILPSLEIQDLSIELFIPSTTSKDEVSEFEDLLSDYCAFVSDDKSHSGQIEIMDENGQVIGTVISPFPNARIEEDPNLNVRGHEKDPVLLELPPQEMESGQKAEIADQRLRVKRAPMQSFPQAGGSKSDWIVSGAQYVSSGLIKGSTLISKGLNNAADSYTARTKPAEQPLVSSPDQSDFPSSNRSLSINPAQQPSQAQGSSALGSLNRYSGSAVKLSKKTTSVVLNAAAGVGGRVGRAAGIQPKVNADGSEGPPPTGIRGIVNRSLIAASVVLDGIDQGAQNLLEGGSEASSKVIGHKYGESARVTAGHSAGTARNLFLIYKDVSGIRRKCLLKMAGGTFKARLNNGEEVEMSVNELPQQQLQHQGQGSTSTTTPPSYSRTSSFGGNGNSIAPPPPHPKSGASTPNKEKW